MLFNIQDSFPANVTQITCRDSSAYQINYEDTSNDRYVRTTLLQLRGFVISSFRYVSSLCVRS